MRQMEKGFTLIEVVITIAILGIVMPAMAMTISTLLTNHQQANDHNIVSQQVQNAGYWISRDVQAAKYVIFTQPSGFPLTLVIPVDTNENNDYSVDYVFDGNKLKRKVYNSSHTFTKETLIAEYIDVADTVFTTIQPNNHMLVIRASKGKVVVERSYEVTQRPGSV